GQCALKVAAYGAADAAVAKFDDLFFALLDQKLVVDAFGPEFVFDDRDFLAVVLGEDALEQRGFTRAQKTGKYGDRNHFVQTRCHRYARFRGMRTARRR